VNRNLVLSFAVLGVGASLLTGCTSGGVAGTASPVPSSASAATGSAAGDVPKVQDPLPASVLDGSPCDTALTTAQVDEFIGPPKPAERDNGFVTGPKCSWFSVDGVSGSMSVFYDTKAGGGLSLDYRNTKPQSSRWEPTTLQGYPAVAFNPRGLDQKVTGTCSISVGINDDLTYGVGMTLGDNARKKGTDSCEAAKDVANTVLTNLKGRA
jgi:Protein of unknown function (DUF3558)